MNKHNDDSEPEEIEHFYEQIYGLSRLSPRYWWRRRVKHRLLFALLFLAIAVVPLAIALKWSSIKPLVATRYHELRAEQYFLGAQHFLSAGDAASAQIQSQNGLRHRPGNPDALALHARILKKLGNPGYSVWALQAHLAKPDDPKLAILALGSALEERQAELAAFLVSQSLPRFPSDAFLHILACHHHIQQGNLTPALREARQAKQLDPKNPEAYFLVAALSARNPDPALRSEGLAGLRNFRNDPRFATRAAWALVAALAPREPAAAIAILDELIGRQDTEWPARLRRLVLVHRTSPASTHTALRQLWAQAQTAPQRQAIIETAETIDSAEAQDLLSALPAAERDSLPMLLAQFRIWASSKAWSRLAETANAAIGRAENDTTIVTLAVWHAKALHELGATDGARATLRSAFIHCQTDMSLALEAATRLERLGLTDAAIDFYAVAADAPGRLGSYARARSALAHRDAGRTDRMLAVWEKALAANPRDPQAMNNVAACLLLLDAEPQRALKLATEAHAANPKSVDFADTHALALASNGRVPEALAIHKNLPPARLQNPEFALNYASVLFKAGERSQAAALLTNLNESTLIPEQIETLLLIRSPSASPPPRTRSSPATQGTPPPVRDPELDRLLLPLAPPIRP